MYGPGWSSEDSADSLLVEGNELLIMYEVLVLTFALSVFYIL
jgi:hypothetical protein